jgi:hypothetical protein
MFYRFIRSSLFIISLFSYSYSQEFTVISPSGEAIVMEIDSAEPFTEAIDRMANTIESLQEANVLKPESIICVNYSRNAKKGMVSITNSPTRDYTKPLSTNERADITFIISNVGNSSLITLAKIKKDIKEAGNRVDHVHPLRFLECIFVDEALKVAVNKIPGRIGWVSDPFFDGLYTSLSEEAAKDNIKEEFIQDFATTVGLSDPNIILPSIKSHNWPELFHLLVKNLPRKGKPDRYDM